MSFSADLINEILSRFLLYSFFPILLIFIFERYAIYFLRSSPDRIKWVREQFWLHQNFITRCRYPMGLVSVLFYEYISVDLGIIWFGAWIITDITDGSIARHFDLHTEEGKIIDPLSDKLFYFPPLFYFGLKADYFALNSLLVFLTFDSFGQLSRYFIEDKSANLFGKTKTFFAVLAVTAAAAHEVYLSQWELGLGRYSDTYKAIPNYLLLIAILFAFCSLFFKIVPHHWYANILSILNFACGVTGIILLSLGYPAIFAFGLVFLGQFLDLFDGRAAERWGSTPKGELLDDLADATSFGGTIAAIIFVSLNINFIAWALAVFYFLCTIFRLTRFLWEKRVQNITGGVKIFSGLPAPAGSLLAGSSTLLFQNSIVWQSIFIFLSGVLMVSRIPYLHFGRVILPSLSVYFKVFLLALMVTILISAFLMKKPFILLMVLFISSCLYAALGISRPTKKLT